MLFDSHCHIDAPEFDDDRPAVLRAAKQAGISHIAVPAYLASRWSDLLKLCAASTQQPDWPRLLPALAEAFPQFRQTFARSASHAAEAQTLLSELAAQDLLQVGTPPELAKLQALSRPRQSNVLRHWLVGSHQARPSAAQLAQLLDQIAVCTTRGHQIRLKVAQGHVLRQGPQLAWQGSI